MFIVVERTTMSDAVIEYYKKHVDQTLLDENLKRTVQERFDRFTRFMEGVQELRRAGEHARRTADGDVNHDRS